MATSVDLDDKYDEFVSRYSHNPSIDQFKRWAKIKYLDAKKYMSSRKKRKTSADLPTKTTPSLMPKNRANRSYSSYNNITKNIRKPPSPPKAKKTPPPLPPVKSTKTVNVNTTSHQHSYSVDINNNDNNNNNNNDNNSSPSTPKHIKLMNNMYSNRIVGSNDSSNSKQDDIITTHSVNNDENIFFSPTQKYQSQKEIVPKPWNNLKINDIETRSTPNSPNTSNTRKKKKISPQNAINHNNNNNNNSSSNNTPTIAPKPWEMENERNNANNINRTRSNSPIPSKHIATNINIHQSLPLNNKNNTSTTEVSSSPSQQTHFFPPSPINFNSKNKVNLNVTKADEEGYIYIHENYYNGNKGNRGNKRNGKKIKSEVEAIAKQKEIFNGTNNNKVTGFSSNGQDLRKYSGIDADDNNGYYFDMDFKNDNNGNYNGVNNNNNIDINDNNPYLDKAVLESPMINTFKLYVAIDFGTDGCGIAYCLPNGNVYIHGNWKGEKQDRKTNINTKIKSRILLDKNGKRLAFGFAASYMYSNINKNNDQNWMLFERFKMNLYDNKNNMISLDEEEEDDDNDDNDDNDDFDEEEKCDKPQNNNSEKKNKKKKRMIKKKNIINLREYLTATNGVLYESKKVFISAFQFMKEQVWYYLKKLKLHNIVKCIQDIQWIITVPAIWDDIAKNKMREWAIDAGLADETIQNHIKIVYEPDCASLSIQHKIMELERRKNDISNSKKGLDESLIFLSNVNKSSCELFENGSKYLLIDAGGGTVDISCHESMGNMKIKEILCPSGGKWGSSYIDDEFIKLLENIFSVRWINLFKIEDSYSYYQLLNNFRSSKHSFYSKTSDNKSCKHNVDLTYEFISFLEEQCEIDDVYLDDIISSSIYSSEIELNGEYLEISYNIWTNILFNIVVDPILNHVDNLLNTLEMNQCKYLCLVGGLSASPYFQYRIINKYGDKLSIIIPKRPIISVIDGAALFGLFNQFVQARVLSKCYGTSVNSKKLTKSWMNKKMILNLSLNEKEKHYNHRRQCYSKIFKPIVLKNQCISIDGKPIIIEGARNISNNKIQKHTTVKIYQCDEYNDDSNTFFINNNSNQYNGLCKGNNNGNMKLMATASIIWPKHDKERNKIIMELYFHDTIIKGYVYAEKYPNQRKVLQLKYQFNK